MTLETQNESLLNQFNTDPLSKKLVLNLDNAIESAKNKILKQQEKMDTGFMNLKLIVQFLLNIF